MSSQNKAVDCQLCGAGVDGDSLLCDDCTETREDDGPDKPVRRRPSHDEWLDACNQYYEANLPEATRRARNGLF